VTEFSKVSFDEIEPVRPGPVDGRFSRAALGGSGQLWVSRFRYAPGTSAPYGHRHEVQEEVYVVVSGSGQMKVGDEVFDLAPWDVVHVAPQAVRAIHAGPDGIELIVAGGARPPEGDGELVDDFWP
jgi:mannose-6-phosphate isomerase-like protein (cupin superfamily)